MGGVLGGVIFLIFTYFAFGYCLYVSDMEAYEKAMDEKESEEERQGGAGESDSGGGAANDNTSVHEVNSPLVATKPPASKGPTSTTNLSNQRLSLPRGEYYKDDALPRPAQRGLKVGPAKPLDHALMRARPPSAGVEGTAGGGDVEKGGGGGGEQEARPLLGGSE